jgi:hypothetical protein
MTTRALGVMAARRKQLVGDVFGLGYDEPLVSLVSIDLLYVPYLLAVI